MRGWIVEEYQKNECTSRRTVDMYHFGRFGFLLMEDPMKEESNSFESSQQQKEKFAAGLQIILEGSHHGRAAS